MKKSVIAALALILAFTGALWAFNGAGLLALGPAPQPDIKVAWIGPLSGSYASLGSQNLRGVQLAVENINSNGGIKGQKVQLVVEDTQSEVKQFLNAAQKVSTADGVNLILTSQYTELFAAEGLAKKNNVIIVDTVDTSNEIAGLGDNIFAIGLYDEELGYSLAEFAAKEKGYKRIGIVFLNSEAFFGLVKGAFKERFESLRGKVVLEEGYNADETDFRTIIEKAKQQNLDALLVLGFDETGFLLRQSRELGFDRQFMGIDLFSSKQFQVNAGSSAEGAIFTFWQPPESPQFKDFTAAYKKKFGQELTEPLFVSTGFDAMNAVAYAMETNGTSTENIRNGLLQIKGQEGLTGNLTMSPDGIVRTITEKIFIMGPNGSFGLAK